MKTGLDNYIPVIDADEALRLFRDGRLSMWWIEREPIDRLHISTITGEKLIVCFPPIELVREFAGVERCDDARWQLILSEIEKNQEAWTGKPSLLENVML